MEPMYRVCVGHDETGAKIADDVLHRKLKHGEYETQALTNGINEMWKKRNTCTSENVDCKADSFAPEKCRSTCRICSRLCRGTKTTSTFDGQNVQPRTTRDQYQRTFSSLKAKKGTSSRF